jgi:GGDEF domain-containing protein
MIRLLASIIVSECDPKRDFAGHVGGDDFVVLFQSGDWEARCTRIISHFNTAALTLFDQQRAAADSSKPKTDRATTPPSR